MSHWKVLNWIWWLFVALESLRLARADNSSKLKVRWKFIETFVSSDILWNSWQADCFLAEQLFQVIANDFSLQYMLQICKRYKLHSKQDASRQLFSRSSFLVESFSFWDFDQTLLLMFVCQHLDKCDDDVSCLYTIIVEMIFNVFDFDL